MPDTPVMNRLIRRSVERRVPLSVHFDLTYRCNERCVHCYLDHEDYGELGTDEIRNILTQLAGAGTLMLTFSGGEIFLRADLFDLLAYARDLHFDISLKSNALMVTRERAARLRALGVRKIQISIYSADASVHDAITKVRGSFVRSLRAICFLKSEGLRVKIACPLMRQNLAGVSQLQTLAADLDVPYVFDMTITPKLDGDTSVLALRTSAQDLLPVLQNATLNPGAESVVSSGIESSGYEDIPCSAGHNSCYITPYGDVYPCVQLPLPSGNLRQESFEAIWRGSPQLETVREVRESALPICSTCAIRQYCERCPGLAMMEGGDLLGAYDRACELAEMKARLNGVKNPISAFHLQPEVALRSAAPTIQLAHLVQIGAAS
jgi:AdoMet-dependent heme synthase